jgi:putative ABC transport system permease protein
MQLGFLTTARHTSSLVYNFFDYDLILTSTLYESMNVAGDFDKTRLYQARAVPGVGEIATLNYALARWRDPENNDLGSSCMLLGSDLNPRFFLDERTIANLPLLMRKDSLILDELAHADYGSRPIGKRATINHRNVEIAALYRLGVSFHAEGSAIVSQETFQGLAQPDPRRCTFGLIKVAPGADREAVKERLKATLPGDVLVFDRRGSSRPSRTTSSRSNPWGSCFRPGPSWPLPWGR